MRELAEAVFGPDPGMHILLLLTLVMVSVGFWLEKRKNDKVAEERLREAREDTELLVDTVNEAVSTVREFKTSNEALAAAFEALTDAVREGHPEPKKDGPEEGGAK